MEEFIQKHEDKIKGVLSCFDRMIFRGWLPISNERGMESYLYSKGLLLKDFKQYVSRQADRVVFHAKGFAKKHRRPYEYFNSKFRKEAKAREIAKTDGITKGLICVFSCLETCRSFRLKYGKKRPHLRAESRKCLCLYYYFMDPEFGFMHVRIQTWFPFTVQVYINGHEWLARKMDRHGLKYKQADNTFVYIEDVKRTQMFSNRLEKKNWPKVLDVFANKVNPLYKDDLSKMSYYWVTCQAEYATDIIFRDKSSLSTLMPRLMHHSLKVFSADDVMRFLGRKLHGNYLGEVTTDLKSKRLPMRRIKHCVGSNWIKMYDKFCLVLRIEIVINEPRDFRMRAWGKRHGKRVKVTKPMKKSVVLLDRYRKVSLSANARYLTALAVVDDPEIQTKELDRLTESKKINDRSFRAFNPLAQKDLKLFTAALRGEHTISGIRNHNIRKIIHNTKPQNKTEIRRQSSNISRQLKRLHVFKLIAKIPHSHKWKVTAKGYRLMSTSLYLRKHFCDKSQKAA